MDIFKALDESHKIAKKLIETEHAEPVLPYHSPEDYQQKVNISLGEEGQSEEGFFELLEQVSLLTPRTCSPAFFNQLFAGRSAPSLSAELLKSVLNTTMHTYKVSGIQVLLEKEVVRQMLQLIGYKQGEGIINPGGSMSNMVSMMVARNVIEPDIAQKGFSGRKLISYTSDESHYSIKKNAAILGLGRDNVRLIATDEQGCMLPDALKMQIEADLEAGHLPFYINATSGTTVLGVFDPIELLAGIAQQFGLWLHVDAALGGSVLLSERHRKLMKGVHLADSVTWNAHKMMNVPITASFLLMKEKGILRKHLSERAEYLFQNEATDLDLGNSSIQCGRPVDAFKVWAAWLYYGRKGLAARVEHNFEMASYAVKKIAAAPHLHLFRQPESVNVCFTVEGMSPDELCAQLHQQGLAMVGYSSTKGSTFVRLACINADQTFEDLDRFFATIEQVLENV